MQSGAWAFRYGAVAASCAAALIATACSGSSGSHTSAGGSGRPAACTYVAKLDEIAQTVATANVHDPDGFKTTLSTAVHDYVTNLSALRTNAPADVRPSLELVAADVQQYRFAAAATDRAPLDAYAARACGRTARTAPASSNSSTPATTSTLPAPGASDTQPDVPTTAPSDG